MIQRLRDNLAHVRARMDAAALRVQRPAGCVRLVAVTKSVDSATAAALCELGALELGESRAQVLQARHEQWPAASPAPRWHFIGHLQRNKVRAVLSLADEIHSLDSERLLEALAEAAAHSGRRPAVWIELNLVGASARTGLTPAQLPALLARAHALPQLRLQGLMTIAPLPDGDGRDEQRAREVFERLRALGASLDAAQFEGGRVRYSMGMSSDFEVAIEAGSDLVRVGSALFEGLDRTRSAAGGAA